MMVSRLNKLLFFKILALGFFYPVAMQSVHFLSEVTRTSPRAAKWMAKLRYECPLR
jgi:hypothetical protein